MSVVVAFGWAVHNTGEPCAIDVRHPHWTLCKRRAHPLPATVGGWDADIPTNLHPECRSRMAELGAVPQEDDQRYGMCPECHGDVPVVDGVICGHGEWRMGRRGLRQISEPCPGEGELPEAEG